MRGRGGLRIVALAAVGTLALAPVGADAKKKKKKPKAVPVTVVQTSGATTADNQKLSLTPTCPSGQLVVGGGFLTGTSYTGAALNDLNVIYASHRTAPGTWTVDAVREDAGGAGPSVQLTAYADCRSTSLGKKKKGKKKKVLSISEATATSSPVGLNTAASASANCTGVPAIGGGFTSSPVPDLAANTFPMLWASSRSGPSTWTTSFTNRGSVSRTVTSQVLCATGLKLSEGSAVASLPPGQSGPTFNNPLATATSPACAKGSSQLGGGFSFTANNITAGPVSILTESAPGAGQWRASAASLAASSAVPVTSTGYCG